MDHHSNNEVISTRTIEKFQRSLLMRETKEFSEEKCIYSFVLKTTWFNGQNINEVLEDLKFVQQCNLGKMESYYVKSIIHENIRLFDYEPWDPQNIEELILLVEFLATQEYLCTLYSEIHFAQQQQLETIEDFAKKLLQPVDLLRKHFNYISNFNKLASTSFLDGLREDLKWEIDIYNIDFSAGVIDTLRLETGIKIENTINDQSFMNIISTNYYDQQRLSEEQSQLSTLRLIVPTIEESIHQQEDTSSPILQNYSEQRNHYQPKSNLLSSNTTQNQFCFKKIYKKLYSKKSNKSLKHSLLISHGVLKKIKNIYFSRRKSTIIGRNQNFKTTKISDFSKEIIDKNNSKIKSFNSGEFHKAKVQAVSYNNVLKRNRFLKNRKHVKFKKFKIQPSNTE